MTRIILILAALLLAAPAAWAHAFLQRADPPVGSEVSAAPQAVTLTFTEPVEPHFSRVEVRDAHDKRVDAGELHATGPKVLVVGVPHLAAGGYTVIWHVTSVDTHRTEGRFSFTVTH